MANEPRKPGRPPISKDDDSVKVCLTLPCTQYDDFYVRAQKARVSVPEVIRRDLNEKRTFGKF